MHNALHETSTNLADTCLQERKRMYLLKDQRCIFLFFLPNLPTQSSRLYSSQLTVVVSTADVFAELRRITDTKNSLCQNLPFLPAQFICFVGFLCRHQRLPSVLIQTKRDRPPLSWHSQSSHRPSLFCILLYLPASSKANFYVPLSN
jgi:hypothetical protein